MRNQLIQVSYTAIWGHVMVWACAGAEGHVWIHGSTATGICLCSMPWPMLPPEAECPWAVPPTWSHVAIPETCCHRAILSLLPYYQGHGYVLVTVVAEGYVGAHDSTTAGVCDDVYGPFYHQCLAATRGPALPSRVIVMSGPKQQQKAMSGFIVLPKPGSVLMSMAHFYHWGSWESWPQWPGHWRELDLPLTGHLSCPLLGELAPVVWAQEI